MLSDVDCPDIRGFALQYATRVGGSGGQHRTFRVSIGLRYVLNCDMDIEKLAKELIKALRGRRSQLALSRRLGYSSNVLHAWECGRRWPASSETLRIAERTGVDLRKALTRFYRTPPEWLAECDLTSPEFVWRFLQDQRGSTTIATLAERAGTNRFSMARWLNGEAEPRLPDFLRVVEATSLRLLDLIATLVDPDQLPSARDAWRRREAQRGLAIEEPWTQAVLRFLELPGADGSAATIARRLRLEQDVVAGCLVALGRAGQAKRIGDRWHPVQVEAVDTRRTEETSRRLKGFWADVGSERLRIGARGTFAYNVFAVSEDQFRRLEDLQQAYYQSVRALVAEEVPAECVALVNLQMIRLDDG
jgi:DNA-binding phage protein